MDERGIAELPSVDGRLKHGALQVSHRTFEQPIGEEHRKVMAKRTDRANKTYNTKSSCAKCTMGQPVATSEAVMVVNVKTTEPTAHHRRPGQRMGTMSHSTKVRATTKQSTDIANNYMRCMS